LRRRASQATEALLAQIAVAKYADGLPLYRQEAIYARDKVELDRQLMAQWMGKLGFELEIMADYIFSEVKKAERVFADETTLQTLAPGSGSTKTAYLWAYARDDRTFGRNGPPMVAYRFEDSRSGECAVRHLNGYRGILQVDGYAAYNKLARSDRGNDCITGWLLVTLQTQVLRAACCRELRSGNGDGRADGEVLAGRENDARSKPRHSRCRAPASLRGDRRRSLRSLAADLASDLRQINTG
jgi:hypothetical protein